MPWHALILPAAVLLAFAAGMLEHRLRSRTPPHRWPRSSWKRLTCDGVNCPDGVCFCGAFE